MSAEGWNFDGCDVRVRIFSSDGLGLSPEEVCEVLAIFDEAGQEAKIGLDWARDDDSVDIVRLFAGSAGLNGKVPDAFVCVEISSADIGYLKSLLSELLKLDRPDLLGALYAVRKISIKLSDSFATIRGEGDEALLAAFYAGSAGSSAF